jgi:RNA polymerase sigma-70 factor, ECF subfamily
MSVTPSTTLDSLLAALAARWPAVRFDRAALADALAARELGPESSVAADVALACALAAGDLGALAVFERELVPDVRGALVRIDRSGDLVDEALQRVREKLFVGERRVREYRGRGSLVAWIQVIAIREGLALRRRERRDGPSPSPSIEDALLVAVESDPALALTRRAYRVQFADVFRAALAGLAPRERALLRLTFVDGAGTERLAAMYGVHRVTMFRWLADARAHLLELLRAGVIDRIGIATSEVDSLIRAVASSLDVGW